MTDVNSPKPPRAMELLKRTKGRLVSQGMVDPHVAAQIDVVADVAPPQIPPVIESKAPPVEAPHQDPNSEVHYDLEQMPPETPVEPKKVIPRDLIPEDLSDDVDSVIDPRGSTAENFGKLRKKAKALNSRLKELEGELETARSYKDKVAQYETGEAVPEAVELLNQRIAELEPLEAVLNIEKTPAYRERVTVPMETAQRDLNKLAEEAGVTQEQIQAAYSATGSEQNRMLLRAFGDELNALEARKLLQTIKGIQVDSQSLKQNASESLSALQADSVRIETERKAKQYNNAVVLSQDAWKESVVTLRGDDRFPYTAMREGDSVHNKQVQTLLSRASGELGKMVTDIAQNGLTKNTLVAMARANTLAHHAGVVAAENAELRKENAALRAASHDHASLNNPGVNSGTSMSAPIHRKYQNKFGAGSGEQAGRNVLNRVTGR